MMFVHRRAVRIFAAALFLTALLPLSAQVRVQRHEFSGSMNDPDREAELPEHKTDQREMLAVTNTIVELLRQKKYSELYNDHLSPALKERTGLDALKKSHAQLLEQAGEAMSFLPKQWAFRYVSQGEQSLIYSMKIVHHTKAVLYYILLFDRNDLKQPIGIQFRTREIKAFDFDSHNLKLWMQAARAGDLDGLRRLQNEGFDAQRVDEDGRTALLHAVVQADRSIIEFLLNAGVPINQPSAAFTVNDSPVSSAAFYRELEIVRYLVDRGANIEHDRYLALRKAARAGRLDTVRYLLSLGAQIDSHTNGWTALTYAAHEGHADVVAFLLKEGANPNIKDSDSGRNLLRTTVGQGHIEIVRMLLEKGAEVDSMDADYQWTAFLWACRHGNAEMAELLIQHGADMNHRGKHGTCSEFIKEHGHEQMRKLLEKYRDADKKL